ncbi:MAG: c-type cytochrome biogenesis protein CcmI [Hyphomicrobiales bacterium]
MEIHSLFFWIIAGILTIAAILSAIWPLVREKPRHDDEGSAADNDREGTRRVLIDQLDEIERDRERGLMNDEEAKGARAELGRRLLALEQSIAESAEPATKTGRVYPWISIVLIPVLAVGAYHYLGNPGLPDQPIAARLAEPPENQDIALIVSRIEKHLETNANDLNGWRTLAPVYQRMNRLDDAEKAYRKWLELVGDDKASKGEAQLGLGQILTAKNEGQVNGEAFAVFEQAAKNVPNDATAFFFLAVGLTQQNKTSEGISAWTSLIDRFGDNNPRWLPMANNALASLKAQEQAAAGGENQPNITGPTDEQIEGANQLSTSERNEFIESMVSRLADRLNENPDDVTGWGHLIQSYMVLGRKDQANEALNRALGHFSDNETAIKTLKETAEAQGL